MTDTLVVRGGHVLTLDPQLGTVDADIRVDNGVVTDIRPGLDVPGARVVDATGSLVVPGLIDTHRHMWEAALRGTGADDSLDDYFTFTIGTAAPLVDPETVYVGELLSACAALDAGVTTVQDIANIHDTSEHSDAAADALRASGLRTVLAYGHSPSSRHTDAPAPGALSRDAERMRNRLAADGQGLLTMALAADARTDEAVTANWRLAAELDVPVAMHAMRRPGDEPPLERLARLGVLRDRVTYIHATGYTAEDLARVRDTGGHLSIAPLIELLMGHGYPPVLDALDAGLPPSLSTDVEVTVPGDMFTQMRTALAVARHAGYTRAAAPGDGRPDSPRVTVAQALEMATVEGARALGMEDRIGSLGVGKQADLLVLSTDRPGMRPVHDPTATVVLQAERGDVDTVVVGGRVVKEHGKLLHVRLDRLYERAAAVLHRLATAHALDR
ncbi:amidohydrolase family protein [Streptomyces sp. AV19]|uniref:amidohydrolase family protein n=1 Tax=Streptomyces sp. AV19 TaxID=2793068 RepID=UPI0018FE9984|nr:amidohydrolase family protein [Streptomyces sp. AV19]MBH1933924.1 amidohydrolase family protein [Streptomyces sp. AV19]MDG4535594.1 amidohydrolase family protein [Streptomyces sp. AV19]